MPKCPKCGGAMKLRDGSRGKFWACAKYFSTGCRGTRKYVPPKEITREMCEGGTVQCWDCERFLRDDCHLMAAFMGVG